MYIINRYKISRYKIGFPSYLITWVSFLSSSKKTRYIRYLMCTLGSDLGFLVFILSGRLSSELIVTDAKKCHENFALSSYRARDNNTIENFSSDEFIGVIWVKFLGLFGFYTWKCTLRGMITTGQPINILEITILFVYVHVFLVVVWLKNVLHDILLLSSIIYYENVRCRVRNILRITFKLYKKL